MPFQTVNPASRLARVESRYKARPGHSCRAKVVRVLRLDVTCHVTERVPHVCYRPSLPQFEGSLLALKVRSRILSILGPGLYSTSLQNSSSYVPNSPFGLEKRRRDGTPG